MADIETTLKTRTNQDNVFPNIKSSNIPSGAVTTAKIADGAVTTAKIADGAITNDKIAVGAIYNNNIVDGEVDEDKLAQGSVGTNQLQDGSVTSDKLVDYSVTEDKISDFSVSHNKLKDDNIDLASYFTAMGDFEDFLGKIAIWSRDWRYKFSYHDAVNDIWYPCFPSINNNDMLINFLCLTGGGVSIIQWDENTTPAEASNIHVYSVSAESFSTD